MQQNQNVEGGVQPGSATRQRGGGGALFSREPRECSTQAKKSIFKTKCEIWNLSNNG